MRGKGSWDGRPQRWWQSRGFYDNQVVLIGLSDDTRYCSMSIMYRLDMA